MELKVPVRIDGFECVKDMVNTVLDYSYKGRTLKEWADSISNPTTNADRIRAMSDEELTEWLTNYVCSNVAPYANARGATYKGKLIDWLKQEAE